MQALGYGDYNIYGIFYVTKLALEVMRSAPAGVRLVVIDSVFPPNARAFDTNILPVQEGVQQVITQCVADTACAAVFPDLDATIQRVAVKLEKNPISAARGRPEINVRTLISLIEDRNAYGHWANTTGHMPLVITEWDRGETGIHDLLASGTTARATALGFPEAGHAALDFSRCAKDIGLAFVERPGEPLATGCIETLKPVFILPFD